MHGWPSFGVFLDLAQNLVRDRRDVALAEQDVVDEVSERVALAPTEIDVRKLARRVAQVEQEGRDGVRHGGTLGAQDAGALDVNPAYLQHARELRRVARRDLEEDDWVARRDVIVGALLALLVPVLRRVAHVAPVRDDANLAALLNQVFDETLRLVVQLDVRSEEHTSELQSH